MARPSRYPNEFRREAVQMALATFDLSLVTPLGHQTRRTRNM
jgi:hypothetical protein